MSSLLNWRSDRSSQALYRWDNKPEDALPLRIDQLTIRQHEIYTAYTAFAALVSSSVNTDTSKTIEIVGKDTDVKSWSNAPINFSDICLAGHSFGGATMVCSTARFTPLADNCQR